MRLLRLVPLVLILAMFTPAVTVHATTPTHYVNSATGSDSNNGLTSGTAWKSLIPVPAALALYTGDMVVQVTGPVVSKGINGKLAPHAGSTLTIQGSTPAVTTTATSIGGNYFNISTPANYGSRAQVEPIAIDLASSALGPTGGSAADLPSSRFGAWTSVTVNGHSVWRTPHMVAAPRVATWAPSRTGDLVHRIPVWLNTDTAETILASASNWVGAAFNATNVNTSWGLYDDRTYNYLIPPPDGSFTNPNNVWIWTGAGSNLYIDGPDVTLKDMADIGGWSAITVTSNGDNAHILGMDIRDYQYGIQVISYPVNTYAQSLMIENNRFSDDGNWVVPGSSPTAGQFVSWSGFKSSIAYGSSGNCSCFRAMESVAIWGQGGSQFSTYQNNTVDGGVDGFDAYPVAPGGSGYDSHSDEGLTIYHNYLRYLSDDAFDRTGNQVDVTINANRVEYAGTFVSLAWTAVGPMTITNNVGWMIGGGARLGGTPGGYDFKMGNTSAGGYVQPTVSVNHNTFWTTTSDTEAVNPGGGAGANIASLHMSLNIIRQQGLHILKVGNTTQLVEDYNDWSEADSLATNPFETTWGNFTDIVPWRTASSMGAHSNARNSSLYVVPDSLMVDPTNGNVHITGGSLLGAP